MLPAFFETQAATMKLYSNPLCPFAHGTRLAVAEKGINVNLIDVDLRNMPASIRTLTPTGTIPMLSTGEYVIWDSEVIAEYLEEAYPEPALLPREPVLRAQARIWMRFANDQLYANTKRLLLARDDAERESMLAKIYSNLRFMAQEGFPSSGSRGPWWLGARYTLVDVTFYPWFEQRAALEKWRGFEWPRDCDELLQWERRMAARSAVCAEGRSPSFYVDAYGALMSTV